MQSELEILQTANEAAAMKQNQDFRVEEAKRGRRGR
jgi:tRNA(Ser,Leu) C12 N-acetylase TAN1